MGLLLVNYAIIHYIHDAYFALYTQRYGIYTGSYFSEISRRVTLVDTQIFTIYVKSYIHVVSLILA